MAVIEWEVSAWAEFSAHVKYAREEYGKKTMNKWLKEIDIIYDRLQKYPTSYTIERLLNDMPNIYRSCHLMNRRFKLIYYYHEPSDTVYIVDLWDTRMNPDYLRNRIR